MQLSDHTPRRVRPRADRRPGPVPEMLMYGGMAVGGLGLLVVLFLGAGALTGSHLASSVLGDGALIKGLVIAIVSPFLMMPGLNWFRRLQSQSLPVQQGRIAEGFIIRHQPFNRKQKRQPSPVFFEYTPQDAESPLNASMWVDPQTYRSLSNRQKVTVLYLEDRPERAVVYDICDVEAVAEWGEEWADEDEVAAAETARSIKRIPLPKDMDHKYGLGPVFLRWMARIKTVLLAALLACPFWGIPGYGLKATRAHSVALVAGLYVAPWLLLGVMVMIGGYAAAQGAVFWYLKTYPPPSALRESYTLEDVANQDWDPEEIEDPIKSSLKKTIGR